MGIGHAAQVFELDYEWTGVERAVALEMAYRADRKGVVRISQVEIAEKVGYSLRTVAGAVDRLYEMGLIVRLGHGRYGLDYAALNGEGVGGEDAQRTLPAKKGADVEFKRLQGIRTPDQTIVWRPDGWPVLDDAGKYGIRREG